jgi:hypothetical protein
MEYNLFNQASIFMATPWKPNIGGMWQFLLLVSSLLAMETFQNQFICELQEFETKKKKKNIQKY